MAQRRDPDPSPFRTGLTHAGVSLLVFGGLAAALGTVIHYSGNPDEAGPREVLALFDTPATTDPVLKSRLKSAPLPIGRTATVVLPEDEGSGDEPSLGIEYAENAPAAPSASAPAKGEEESTGIRINGQLVRPGESYGEVTRVVSLEPAPISGMTERVNGRTLPRISAEGRAPSEVYARPFANPGNRPVVALVVGGLGINSTHTRSAIDELPPEVTLSFAPDAGNLQYWVNKARAAGHEVLIEVPMEAFDYGRMKMHPETLIAADTGTKNIPRLERLLSKASGYFGVINYQGAKFAEDPGAVGPVMAALGSRGLALIEDGSFQKSVFDAAAGRTGLRYARATSTIDAKLTAEDIGAELLELETLAREHGAALGAGYAFPLTIETAKNWTAELDSRGIVLAPVSALTAVIPAEISGAPRVQTGSLGKAPVNPEG